MISSIFSDVCSFHVVFSLSSRSVVDLAMSRGMDVNNDTISNEAIVSSGLIFRFLMWVKKVLTLSMECVEDFVRGFRSSERCLARLYVGEPGKDTMGRKGMVGLWIFGRP